MNAYNAYGYRGNVTAKRNRSALRTALRFMRAVAEVVMERIRGVEVRAAFVVIGFALALGLVGGMESGAVPLYIGLPICLVLAAAGLLTHFDD